ncbi:hypothetical protein F7725_007731 [Dissostichus mawsoni]|uniref:Uncharacterized protein n=1 Tax=Dissostichus mawsoni TaxID=36200 RepID=A0A7J5Y888_DISMA|nr:hypothetical protein F7725_007731 [Dissostichus mawsoni]
MTTSNTVTSTAASTLTAKGPHIPPQHGPEGGHINLAFTQGQPQEKEGPNGKSTTLWNPTYGSRACRWRPCTPTPLRPPSPSRASDGLRPPEGGFSDPGSLGFVRGQPSAAGYHGDSTGPPAAQDGGPQRHRALAHMPVLFLHTVRTETLLHPLPSHHVGSSLQVWLSIWMEPQNLELCSDPRRMLSTAEK